MSAVSRLAFSRSLLSIILLLLMSAPGESACVNDALNRVDKDTVLMDSTALYRVLDDWRAVVFWLPLSKVTICDQVDDEMEIYYEIRNQDQNQMVRADERTLILDIRVDSKNYSLSLDAEFARKVNAPRDRSSQHSHLATLREPSERSESNIAKGDRIHVSWTLDTSRVDTSTLSSASRFE